MLPIFILEVFNIYSFLNSVTKNTPLKQMCFIISPLSSELLFRNLRVLSQIWWGIFLTHLIKLFKYGGSILLWNDLDSIKLILLAIQTKVSLLFIVSLIIITSRFLFFLIFRKLSWIGVQKSNIFRCGFVKAFVWALLLEGEILNIVLCKRLIDIVLGERLIDICHKKILCLQLL